MKATPPKLFTATSPLGVGDYCLDRNGLPERETSPPSSLTARQRHERVASLLRCNHAEICRQRDQDVASKRWHDLARAIAHSCVRYLLYGAAWTKDALCGSVRTIQRLQDVFPLCVNAKVVSFDVFDTMLYRTVEPPDRIKRLAAQFAAARYAVHGYPVTEELFLYLREVSEWRQRRVAHSLGLDTECQLAEVIHEVLYRLFGNAIAEQDTELLVDRELEIEIAHLRVGEGVEELLEGLKSDGKKIVATSDTYLTSSQLHRIFKHLGIEQWIDAIYTSAEHRLGKYSGRLFGKLLSDEAIEPAALLHVGDTYRSDIRGAVKSGVAAVLLFDVQRLWHRRKLAQANARPVGRTVTPLQQSRVEATRRNATLRSDQGHPEIYRIGRDYLGPAFTCFVYHIIKECERIGADDIYYFAREGRLFQHIHEILVDHMECLKPIPLVRLHYLYVSRLATSLPAIREIGQRELHLALYRDPNATLRQCIEAFGLAADDVAHLDFALDDRAESTKAALFAQPEFKSRVSMRAAMARAQLRRYLAQEEFFQPEEVKIFVDIGWNATIQANLAQAFHDDAKFPMALGYYFGRKYRHEDYVVSSRSLYMPGVFFDQMRPAGPEYAIGHCLELFELAAAAPHGATLGYREAEHHVTPVLNAGHAALSNEQLLLQSGIVDFAQRFARSYTSGVDIEWLKAETVDRLAQLILRPTLKQAEALRCLHHSLDWGSEKTRPLIAPNMGPRLFLKPARFIEALSNSYWLEGCVRVTRVPGAFSLLKLARWSKRLLEVARRMRRASGNLFAS